MLVASLVAALVTAWPAIPPTVKNARMLDREIMEPRLGEVYAVVLLQPGCVDCGPVVDAVKKTAMEIEARVIVAGWGASDQKVDVVVVDPKRLPTWLSILYTPEAKDPIVAVVGRNGVIGNVLLTTEARDPAMVRLAFISAWLWRKIEAQTKMSALPDGVDGDDVRFAVELSSRSCTTFHLDAREAKAQSTRVEVRFKLPPTKATPVVAVALPDRGSNGLTRCIERKLIPDTVTHPLLSKTLLPTTTIDVDVVASVELNMEAARWPAVWKGVVPKD